MAPRTVNAGAAARKGWSFMQDETYTFTERDLERFWSKVDQTGRYGCWLWTASVRPDGYGQLWHPGELRPIVAHRWAYLAFVGPIPEDLELDHLCRVRHCVNPAHLEAVPQRVNLLRGISPAAQNARKTHCSAGHALVGANLEVRDGKRKCVTCRRRRSRERMARDPEKRAAAMEYHRERRRKLGVPERLTDFRYSLMAGMWNDGWHKQEIADVFETTPATIATTVAELRRRGLVGYRPRVTKAGARRAAEAIRQAREQASERRAM